jgi:UDP-N-acetylmuramoylalanine--D-glutamate ligase
MKLERILIFGGGESGAWAGILAAKNGIAPYVIDQGAIKPEYTKVMDSHKVPYTMEIQEIPSFDSYDLVVCSPGIPDSHIWMQRASELGISVVSELEFASWFNRKKVIAITGSNGKTTTSKLCYHLLKSCGKSCALGGNYGICFAHLLVENPEVDIYVLEVSSFQLDHIRHFQPDIAVILNITADHLDRYAYDIANYQRAKFNIASKQTISNTLILNKNLLKMSNAYHVAANQIHVLEPDSNSREISLCDGVKMALPADRLLGKHNAFNAICALEAARIFVSDLQCLENSLGTFEGDPHRLEYVGEIEGIQFINDSKATNVDAVYYALDAVNQPIVWIVGGQDKGNDYSVLDDLVKEKVKAIVCLGIDNKKIINHFHFFSGPILEVNSAESAVAEAIKHSKTGDCVLLSPACASFDLFRNYIDRGDRYKNAINSARKNGIYFFFNL